MPEGPEIGTRKHSCQRGAKQILQNIIIIIIIKIIIITTIIIIKNTCPCMQAPCPWSDPASRPPRPPGAHAPPGPRIATRISCLTQPPGFDERRTQIHVLPEKWKHPGPNGWQITPKQQLGGHFTAHLPAIGGSWTLSFVHNKGVCLLDSTPNALCLVKPNRV